MAAKRPPFTRFLPQPVNRLGRMLSIRDANLQAQLSVRSVQTLGEAGQIGAIDRNFGG